MFMFFQNTKIHLLLAVVVLMALPMAAFAQMAVPVGTYETRVKEFCGKLVVAADGNHRYRWGCGRNSHTRVAVHETYISIKTNGRWVNITQTADGFDASWRYRGSDSRVSWIKVK